MVGKILGIIVLVVVVLVLALVVGPCVYYNFIEDTSVPESVPDYEDATHSFYIENTGGLIFASDFEQHGQTDGKRLFILHGYWEMRGNKFKYIPLDVIIDENIFGKIKVKERIK